MDRREERLRALGQSIAAEEEALLRDREPAHVRCDRFLAAARPAPRRSRGRILLAASLAAAIAATGFFVARPRPPLSFEVGAEGAAHPGALGAWVATPPDCAVPVRFSDGTMVQVQPDGMLRVTAVTPHGARVVLENGALRAAVARRPGARWSLESGPFSIVVEAASFDLRWDLGSETLTVGVAEGAAAVSGPILGREVVVRGGEVLSVARKQARFSLHARDRAPVEPTPEPPITAEPPAPAPSPTAPPSASSRASRPVARRAPEPSWRELVAAGSFPEALASAEGDGLRRILAEGSAADLRDLADAARLSGDGARAAEVLHTLRRRFAGSDQAAEAAFLLGLLSFDAAPAEAARWFGAYLDERPSGRLGREAAGRLIEASERAGDRARAVAAARRYLATYPAGPHAEMARGLAGAP